MAERWAERSVADLVLRAWCPFLMNRGPVSQLDTTPTRGMPAVPPPISQTVGDHVEPMSLGAVGLSLPQSLRTVICLDWGRELQGAATDSEWKNQPTPSHPVVESLEAALLIHREKGGWPFLAERHPLFTSEPLRCVCRDRCDEIPDSAVCEWFADPVSSGGRYPAHAYRALPG
jgi:hypothetical protein